MALNPIVLRDYNEIMRYRDIVMTNLLSSVDLAYLCLNHEVLEEETEQLINLNYIPSLFVDNTITKTEAYIMYDFKLVESKVDTYNNITLIFNIFCHKDIAFLENGIGTRCDCIISELNRLFMDKNKIGNNYNSRLIDDVLQTNNANYIGRQVAYFIKDFREVTKLRAKS